MRIALLLPLLLTLSAHAADFQCSRGEGGYLEKYIELAGSEAGLVSTERTLNPEALPVFVKMGGGETSARSLVRRVLEAGGDSSGKVYRQARKVIAHQWQLAPGAAGKFNLVGDGKVLGEVTASPIRGYEDRAELKTALGKVYQCRFEEELVPAAPVPAESAAALQEWQKFKQKQPQACSSMNDAQELLHRQGAPVTVLLLQGYAVSPATMLPVAEYFGNLGMNVLVPRLRGHYDLNPRDLDTVKAEEWIKQSEQAFQIAAKMSPKVLVVGYSLGGLLGARLALKYPKQVAGFIGLSPALRLTTKTSALSNLGSLLGLSANDALGGSVQSCRIYISSKGGLEVARVLSDTEQRFGGSEADASSSAFGKIKPPSLVFTVADDDTVDSAGVIAAIPGGGKKHALVTLANGDHDSWSTEGWTALIAQRSPLSASKQITDHIAAFLQANGIN